ncbi:MAG: hypothetical protein WCT08_04960 [Patescibacteria group bacterium]|jgi:hypothetical protein
MGERITFPIEESPIVNQAKFDRHTNRLHADTLNTQLDLETEANELANEWEQLLSLFGTDRARDRFVQLCRQYQTESYKYQQNTTGGENYRRKSSSSPDSHKSVIHNEIMETLRKLIVIKDWPKKNYGLLAKLQDRKTVEKMLQRLTI